jgi:transposase
MKKHITGKKTRALPGGPQQQPWMGVAQKVTVGIDLGDRESHYCMLSEEGQVVSRGRVATTKSGLREVFEKMPASRIALEVGTHSPWVSRELAAMGHQVIVANPHKVKLITQSTQTIDAEKLARLARVDPQLLSPVQHRGAQAQADLAVIRARAELVKVRSQLIVTARGLTKSQGERLKPCDGDQVKVALAAELGAELRNMLEPLLRSVETISEEIANYDRQLEELQKRYPEVELLTQVYGVGLLIGLTYMLTVDDPERFAHSRDAGAFVGLKPKQRESGDQQPQLGISKGGDRLLRSYLVQAAHCILRQGAPPCDLQEWGRAHMQSGGKRGKKRAVVAVARKLAVLLHRLWVSGEVYDPRYNQKAKAQGAKAKAA